MIAQLSCYCRSAQSLAFAITVNMVGLNITNVINLQIDYDEADEIKQRLVNEWDVQSCV